MRHGRRGIAILSAAAILMVIIPFAGLAVDAGILFVLQERLSAAVDAAAVAAARGVSAEVASDTARRFFEANFPAGYLGSKSESRDLQITLGNGQIQLAATVKAPVYLLQLVRAEGPRLTARARARLHFEAAAPVF
jgi:Flp pilus assembly protein TadG